MNSNQALEQEQQTAARKGQILDELVKDKQSDQKNLYSRKISTILPSSPSFLDANEKILEFLIICQTRMQIKNHIPSQVWINSVTNKKKQ